MALGYLGSVTEDGGAELRGRNYFNNLAMCSLFLYFDRNDLQEIEWCYMHDVVHAFAKFVRENNDREEAPRMTKRSCQVCHPRLVYQVQQYRSLVWGEGSPTIICDCLTSVRVLTFKFCRGGMPLGMAKLIHLRFLGLSDNMLSKGDLEAICKLYFLQTLLLSSCFLKEIPCEIVNLEHLKHLDLSCNGLREVPKSIFSLVGLHTLLLESCSLTEIPDEIKNLFRLRHLDISRNKELELLAESICNLVELRILDIEVCECLRGLPEGIHRLQNLQHLLIGFTYVSHRFPQGLAQLSGLCTLCEFRGGTRCNKLGLLKKLHSLSGSLNLYLHFSSTRDLEELVEDAREAKLRNKTDLEKLEINFMDYAYGEMWSSAPAPALASAPASLWMDVIEALEPHRNLKELVIYEYKGSRLPDWISSLNLLKELRLSACDALSTLQPMGKLCFLEILKIEHMKGLKLVGREFLGLESSSSSSSLSTNHVGVVAFPKLKELRFDRCEKWSEWEDIKEEEEESAAVSIMPCLTELYIYGCPDLKKLPHRLLRKASSLQVLNIHTSELYESYEDKEGSPWRSISQNKP